MPELDSMLAFAAIAFAMVLTPGPNMIYLISRSILQGPVAGILSLAGVATGFFLYMLFAALGLTALLMAVPFAYDIIRIAGAIYLGWLAWQAVRPGGASPFSVRDLPHDPPARLFAMGLLTNLLNPKVAVMYLSLLPQFIDPARGSVLGQALGLGMVQIAISVAVNMAIILSASSLSHLLVRHPAFATVQRWVMGTVLAGLAVRMAVDSRR